MHELGLCEGVVEAIRRRARGRSVAWARVRVGGHPVDLAVIRQGVTMAAAGTEAEDLDLDLVADPVRSRCRRCGGEEPIVDATALVACVRCGGIDVDLVGAEESVLEAVAYCGSGSAGTPEPDAHATADRTINREEDPWMRSNC